MGELHYTTVLEARLRIERDALMEENATLRAMIEETDDKTIYKLQSRVEGLEEQIRRMLSLNAEVKSLGLYIIRKGNK